MDEYKELTRKYLEDIKERNMISILAIRLVPADVIASRFGIYKSTVYRIIQKNNINGENILQIIERKRKEVYERLKKGESVERLLKDRKLNVSIEGIERVKSLINVSIRHNTENDNKKSKTESSPIATSYVPKRKNNIQTRYDIQEKIKKMKEKYRMLFEGTTKVHKEGLDKQGLFIEDEKIDKQIDVILSNLENLDKKSQKFVSSIKAILAKAVSLSKSNQLSINQMRKIISILTDEKIIYAFKYFNHFIVSNIKQTTRKMYDKFANTVNKNIDYVTDLNKLEQLYKMIPYSMAQKHYSLNIVREKLIRKIQKIKNENLTKDLKMQGSREIQQIAKNIANGTLNIEEAEETLRKVVEKEQKDSRGNKFKLTKEQKVKQLYYEIERLLINNSNQYKIIDLEKTVSLLKKLTGMGITNVLNIVVTNLINRGQFDEATKLCENYYTKVNDNVKTIYLSKLLKKIKNAKLGNMIHTLIVSNLSSESEEKIWKLIQKEVEAGNVTMSNVIIGRNKDSSKTITLQDIWHDEKRTLDKI